LELAIDRDILFTDMVEIVGVLQWNVTRMRLAVADWRAYQSRALR
jgi:hypothetical protein